MTYNSKGPMILWLATSGGVLPAKTSPNGVPVSPRPLREGQVVRTKGKLRLGEWGQHGWVDIVRAIAEGDFATTIVKVELSDNDLTDGHRTCARSMRVLRIIDATQPIARWVIGQAEQICEGINDDLRRVYAGLIDVAKLALDSSDVHPDIIDDLQAGVEVLASDRASLLERAIVAAAKLALAACVCFDNGVVAKAFREAIIALVKLGDQRLEYPDGLAVMLLALFGDAPASQAPVEGQAGFPQNEASGGAVQISTGGVESERSAEEPHEEPSEPSVQYSEPETTDERGGDEQADQARPVAKSMLAEIPEFDRRVLGRLRTEPPKTNVRMLVIAHELSRPEEEVRAAVKRLARLGLAGFGNRHRREAHATFQSTLSGKPIDEWFQPAMAYISSMSKVAITALASALQMEREEALQICVLLEQRGLVQLSGPGKSLIEAVSLSARIAARKGPKKGAMTSPTMASKSTDDLTRRTNGTAMAEQILAVRPTSPPTRRVRHADC